MKPDHSQKAVTRKNAVMIAKSGRKGAAAGITVSDSLIEKWKRRRSFSSQKIDKLNKS